MRKVGTCVHHSLAFELAQLLFLFAGQLQRVDDIWLTQCAGSLALQGNLGEPLNLGLVENSGKFEFVFPRDGKPPLSMLIRVCFARTPWSSPAISFESLDHFRDLRSLSWRRLQVVQNLVFSQKKGMTVVLQKFQICQNPFDTIASDTEFGLGVRAFPTEFDELLIVGERGIQQLFSQPLLKRIVGKFFLRNPNHFIRSATGELKCACMAFVNHACESLPPPKSNAPAP